MAMRNIIGGAVALAALLVYAAPIAAQEIGVTAAVNPAVQGTPPGLATRTLALGANVAHDEHIVSDAGGLTQLLFNDGSSLTIGPSSDLTLDSYVYDPDQGTGKMALTLGRGALRLVGGRIANSSEVTVTTPAATIGIRGAIAGVSVGPTGQTTAYLGYGQNLSVQGLGGQSQNVTRGNFAITVDKPGAAPSAPQVLTSQTVQTLDSTVQPPANSNGGVKQQPTETTVATSGGTTLTTTVTTPPPLSVSDVAATVTQSVPTPTQPNTSTAQAAQNQSIGAQITAPPSLFTPNATFGPYDFSSYRFTGSIGFTTDAAGVVNSTTTSGAVDYILGSISSTSVFSNAGTASNVVTLGGAQFGIWSSYSGPSFDSFGNQGPNVVYNTPYLYLAVIPTTQLPLSGSISYRPYAFSPIFVTNSGSTSQIGGVTFNGSLQAVFGRAGPNSAQLNINGTLAIPSGGYVTFSDVLANYVVNTVGGRRDFFIGADFGTASNISSTSIGACASGACVVSIQGYLYGVGGAATAAITYDINDNNTNGVFDASGVGLFSYLSSGASSVPSGANAVGFYPNAVLLTSRYTSYIGNVSLRSLVDVGSTDANGYYTSNFIQPIDGSYQVIERGGDIYAQVNRTLGNFVDNYYGPITPSPAGTHNLAFVPTVGLPTSGSLTYSLIAATSPTYVDGFGAPGTFTGNLTASFAPSGATASFSNLRIALSDATYTIASAVFANLSGPFFAGTATFNASTSANHLCNCTSGTARLSGGFAGPGAYRAGLAYTLFGAANVNGAAVFKVPGAGN